MREPRGPLQTVPRLLHEGIDAVADAEQALAEIDNHERLADAHRVKARRLRRTMQERIAAAAEVMAALHRRRQDARGARRRVGAYTGPDRRLGERRVAAPLGRAA